MAYRMFSILTLACLVSIGFQPGPAQAVPIKFTYTGTLDNGGSLDGTSFGAIGFTIMVEGDTDDVMMPNPDVTRLVGLTGTQITLDGFGTVIADGVANIGVVDFIATDDFISLFFGIEATPGAPFVLDRLAIDLPGSSPAPLLGYGFDTDLSLTTPGDILGQGPIQTSGGTLVLNASSGSAVTFQAQVIPLPMTGWLLLSALAGLGLVRRRLA